MDAEILEASRVLGKFLSDRNLTVTSAESCTGGGIACAITAVSGSSGWFNQAYVTYSNDAKQKLVGVSAQTLEKHGAVSRETVMEMAAGAKKAAGPEEQLRSRSARSGSALPQEAMFSQSSGILPGTGTRSGGRQSCLP